MTAPSIYEAKRQMTAPSAYEAKRQMTAPSIYEAKRQMTAPSAYEAKSQMTAPSAYVAKSQMTDPVEHEQEGGNDEGQHKGSQNHFVDKLQKTHCQHGRCLDRKHRLDLDQKW